MAFLFIAYFNMRTFKTLALSVLCTGASATPFGIGSGHRNAPSHAASQEYYDLGCPEGTTKPVASIQEQIAAYDNYKNLLYTENKVAEAFNTYAAKSYINHAPEIAVNGTAAVIAELSGLLATADTKVFKNYVGYDSNGTTFGTTHFSATVPGVPTQNVIDIIRMIGTCLVEHWDDIEAVNGSSPNPIAYFRR